MQIDIYRVRLTAKDTFSVANRSEKQHAKSRIATERSQMTDA